MSKRLMELEPSTPTRAITPVSSPSPMTRGRHRMLFEGTIEPFECASTSPITAEKGKAKKLKVVRSKNPKKK
ncbi:hypothetical protein PVAP13_1KG199315 [Panicum virgatum]|uniref:Uncharacterized protein n=1 Tax=Panicum virgatum TaxID=38727 RepID=A0A8T0XFP2_PANVG|nr:hypothetical protein PVAP13_1KG199315 [Panicum virgatum]